MSSSKIDSTEVVENPTRRHGVAWVALSLALAVHVIDEALTNFLSVYNPAVRTIRERLPFYHCLRLPSRFG